MAILFVLAKVTVPLNACAKILSCIVTEISNPSNFKGVPEDPFKMITSKLTSPAYCIPLLDITILIRS